MPDTCVCPCARVPVCLCVTFSWCPIAGDCYNGRDGCRCPPFSCHMFCSFFSSPFFLQSLCLVSSDKRADFVGLSHLFGQCQVYHSTASSSPSSLIPDHECNDSTGSCSCCSYAIDAPVNRFSQRDREKGVERKREKIMREATANGR